MCGMPLENCFFKKNTLEGGGTVSAQESNFKKWNHYIGFRANHNISKCDWIIAWPCSPDVISPLPFWITLLDSKWSGRISTQRLALPCHLAPQQTLLSHLLPALREQWSRQPERQRQPAFLDSVRPSPRFVGQSWRVPNKVTNLSGCSFHWLQQAKPFPPYQGSKNDFEAGDGGVFAFAKA